MAACSNLESLRVAFLHIAQKATEDDEPCLGSPGIEGVQIFPDSVLGKESVSVEEVRRGYEKKHKKKLV